ncbi:uncharacterized protein LOC107043249 [Diachasma alloeum]|uniref:uncharacterized protein LOC107043249 n=1 Tax=Diachasma alloeum TaxID=454923 RepID=UPI00073832D9|nr:uncharacterized protein LOC107043249 [Diachasma alloeum]
MKRWWRQFVRARTNPVPRGYAADMRHNLSAVYAFAAYNALGLFCGILLYQYYPMTGKEKKQPGRYYARIWQGDDISVYKIHGFTVVDSYEIKEIPKLQPKPDELLEDISDSTPAVTSTEELLHH